MRRLAFHDAHTLHSSLTELAYLLYEPPGGRDDPRPLVLFLHGSGERGHDVTQVTTHGIPKLIERGKNFPFIAVSPQCPVKRTWSELASVLHELLDELVPKLHADAARIYLTGMSMGGYGAWHLSAHGPERFAALVPVCGGGDPSWAPRLRQLPTWVFHGADDQVVPASESLKMVRALEAAQAPVRLTLYPGVGHDSWTRAYDEPELYDWMLAQHRPR